MSNRTFVVGVGMTKFEKPQRREWDYPDMARESGTKALEDAGVDYSQIEQAVGGYVYGEATSRQRAVYQLRLTRIPGTNVNHKCPSGATAPVLGRHPLQGCL